MGIAVVVAGVCRTGVADETAVVPPASAAKADLTVRPARIAAEELPPGSNRLDVTMEQAVWMALKNNPSLKLEQIGPEIVRTFESEARAAFDPSLKGELSRTKDKTLLGTTTTGLLETVRTETDRAAAGLETVLPTGTRLTLEGSATVGESSQTADPLASTRAGLTVSQALLKGFGTGVNLATLRQARIETRISEHEFRGFVQSFVAQVEKACWDYSQALRQMEIYRQSMQLAERQLAETKERIKVGNLAEIEGAAAEAEVALRRESLINADSGAETARLRLLSLLQSSGTNGWGRELAVRMPEDAIKAVPDRLDDHVAVALQFRPELNQARLGLQRNELEIVKTRNGYLPQLDVFVTLGDTGYARTFRDSFHEEEGDGYDFSVGMKLEYPLGDRKAAAGHRRAVLNREHAGLALENLGRLVQVDVRAAFIEVQRAREQVQATEATRKLQEAKMNAETEKLRQGKSTSLLVAQAQRDLLQSQVNEVQAVASYAKALVELFRLDGSLLARRGIKAAGEPVAER